MVNAAQAAVFQPAVVSRRRDGSSAFEHTDTPAVVAENHQFFAQQSLPLNGAPPAFNSSDNRHRLPIAAQEFAARRAGIGLG